MRELSNYVLNQLISSSYDESAHDKATLEIIVFALSTLKSRKEQYLKLIKYMNCDSTSIRKAAEKIFAAYPDEEKRKIEALGLMT